jgi:hypothetical protein
MEIILTSALPMNAQTLKSCANRFMQASVGPSAKAQKDYRLACFYDYIYFQHYCVKKTANELLRLIRAKCL